MLGIKRWKRWQVRPFLEEPHTRLAFAATPSQALDLQRRLGGAIAVWAAREPDGFAAAAAAQGAPLVRFEDGFLRSVGLGSNHVGGWSLVIDRIGIHFDPRTPSTLERLLESETFSQELKDRAARLRDALVAGRLTKYNVGANAARTLDAPSGKRRVLVVGQVENDASVRFGATHLRRNLELLAQVREADPDAWIAFKPHPDTEAGTRPGAVADVDALRHADAIVRDVSVAALFGSIDALHTLTSLAGFEALLRGVPVVTWGRPFYAGWGLTQDHETCERRTRRLTLDELVAGTLILYPRYVDPRTRLPCEVERIVEVLRDEGVADPARERSSLRRVARMGLGLVRSWLA